MVRVRNNFLDEKTLQEIIDDSNDWLIDECRFASNCYRSKNLIHVYDDIKEKIETEFDVRIIRMSLFKHPKENFPVPELKGLEQHIDWDSESSGVLYLIGDEGMGTIVGDQYTEFQTNRIICFDAKTLHNPCFGGKDRIVLTFFAKNA